METKTDTKKNGKASIAGRMATREDSFSRAKDSKKMSVSFIDVTNIEPNPNQPRKHFPEKKIQELADSIKKNGLIQPITVYSKPEGAGYYIVGGERRWRAHKLLAETKIAAVLMDGDPEVLAIVENVQREDLTPFEEAFALDRLRKERQLTNGEVAALVGKDRTTINKILSISSLPEYILDEAADYPNTTKSTFIEIAAEKEPTRQKSMWTAHKQGRLTTADARAERKGEKKSSDLSPTERAIKSYKGVVNKLEGVESFEELEVKELRLLQKKITKLINEKTAQ